MGFPTDFRYVHALYYPSWRVYQNATPAMMDCSKATHVLYAFAIPNDDGVLCHLDEYADLHVDVDGVKGCLEAVLQLRSRYPHLKILISIGGGAGSKSFASLSATEDGLHKFAASTAAFVKKFGFDGLDIDWEHPSNPEQGRNYLSLLTTIRVYLPESLLFSALPAGEWCLRNIETKSVATVLDRIHLMCYDFTGPWSSRSGHQAQLYAADRLLDNSEQHSGDAAVQYLLLHGVPPDKIVIGVPVYGRSFMGAEGPGDNFNGCAGEEGVFEYKDLPHNESVELVDHQLVATSCYGVDCGFTTYDGPATVAAKASYVKDLGLGGLFYWTAVADSNVEGRSLITAGYKTLLAK